MARKSRRTASVAAPVDSNESAGLYTTAIYARLSVENSGKDDDGDSLANQISICKDYLKEVEELQLYDVYEDNGATGTEFDRPGFQRLMEDIRSRKINCIVVKDLSRFGRNYLETGEYLEKIFPFMGVRFIAITDGYDSLHSSDSEEALMIPLKNMINDIYAKDISRKIITSFRARQEKGEFLPPNPPYGYIRSETEKYHYDVDPVAAPYVKLIFEWLSEGVTYSEIRKRLEDMNAVTPSMRKKELGLWKTNRYDNTSWSNRTIQEMATNPTYIGCIVYRRKERALYKGVKTHRVAPDEWLVLPDKHEPIVSKELFEKVRSMLEERKREYKKKCERSAAGRKTIPNFFKGKIYCGECGRTMKINRMADPKGNYMPSYSVYNCSGDGSNRSTCESRTKRYDLICKAVLAAIHAQLEVALEEARMLELLKGTDRERSMLTQYSSEYEKANREMKKLQGKREGLYENFTEGILSEEEYLFAKSRYEEEAVSLQTALDAAKEKKEQLDRVLTGNSEWIKALKRVEAVEQLDQRMVDDLISKVTVYRDYRVDVEFNYAYERRRYEAVLEELMMEAE